jgi:peroxiredoxin
MDQSTCADEESVFRVKVPNYTMYGRRAKTAAIVIGMLATLNTGSARAQAPGQLDTPALDFRAHTLGPQPVARTLADYRGKVVLLAVWATWCPGCRDEMASMQRMYASYAARGFRVVAVSIDRGSDAEISAFARSLGLTFDIVRDDGDILTTYLSRGVPTTFLIDRRGIIRRRNFAAVDWDVEPRLGQIRSLLDEPEPPASPR